MWTWTNASGWTVEDVGGKLLWQLNEQGVEWGPLLRTNGRTLHPVLFGVYEHRIYHHGAGFRPAFERTDREVAGKVVPVPAALAFEPPSSPVGKLIWKVRAKMWYLMKKRGLVKRQERLTRRNLELSERVFSMIQEDESFYLRL